MKFWITHRTPASNYGTRQITPESRRNEGAIDGYDTMAEAQTALNAMRNGAPADYAAELGIEQHADKP